MWQLPTWNIHIEYSTSQEVIGRKNAMIYHTVGTQMGSESGAMKRCISAIFAPPQLSDRQV
jgi:hypothetical protein